MSLHERANTMNRWTDPGGPGVWSSYTYYVITC
jgi:hypothetical protein